MTGCSKTWPYVSVLILFRSKSKNNIGRECLKNSKYFKQKQEEDGRYLSTLNLDNGETFHSVFWVDSRARVAWMQFYDVLVFDVTYKTNKFRMPFEPFTRCKPSSSAQLVRRCLVRRWNDRKVSMSAYFALVTHVWQVPNCHYYWSGCNNMQGRWFDILESQHTYCMWHVREHEIEHLLGYLSWYPNFNQMYIPHYPPPPQNNGFKAGWEHIFQEFNIEPPCWLRNTNTG